MTEALFDLEHAGNLARAQASPMGWAHYTKRGRYLRPDHLRYLNDEIVKAVEKPDGRLLIEMPPRQGKSLLAGVSLSAWHVGRFPDKEVAYCSAALNLARKHGRLARGQFKRDGGRVFGLTLQKDRKSAADWGVSDPETGHSFEGGFRAYGVGSQFTGEGADTLIFDDLVKDAEAADSDVQKEALWDWIIDTAWDRLAPGASVVSIMTRWREDDPHGKIREKLAHEGWTIIRLPMVCDSDDCPLGREQGDLLWPGRFSRKRVENIKKGVPARTWNGKYQQRPTAEEGGIFKKRWWENRRYTMDAAGRYIIDGKPIHWENMLRFAVVDLAFSKKKSADMREIAVFGLITGKVSQLVYLDLISSRDAYPDFKQSLKDVVSKWLLRITWVESEGQQIGMVDDMRSEGIPIKTVGRAETCDLRISGDKENVWHESTPFLAGGRLWVPAGGLWIPEWEHQMLTAPHGGAHDDKVDVTAWGALVADQVTVARPPDLSEPGDEDAETHEDAWGGGNMRDVMGV